MRIVLLAAAILVATADSGRLTGQERPSDPFRQSAQERLGAYNLALEGLEQAQLALRQFNEETWEPLNEQHQLAHNRGNDREKDRLIGEIQNETPRRTRLQGAVRAAEREWERAAQTLISHADSYLDQLNIDIRNSSLEDGSEDLLQQFEEWNAILTEVQIRLEESSPLMVEPLPEARALADDSPADLEAKARLLESRAASDSLLAVGLEEQITTERRRWQRQLAYEDMTIRNRHNETPVVGASDVTGAADSVAVDLTQTPAQRIENLENLRDEYIARVGQLLERARALRQEAERRRG